MQFKSDLTSVTVGNILRLQSGNYQIKHAELNI